MLIDAAIHSKFKISAFLAGYLARMQQWAAQRDVLMRCGSAFLAFVIGMLAE
jgi:hypothetical protein